MPKHEAAFIINIFHDSSPSCIFMSNKDRRDENGDLNCTGEVGSMRKSVYSTEDLDSDATVNKA